jgi:hypothetical protein
MAMAARRWTGAEGMMNGEWSLGSMDQFSVCQGTKGRGIKPADSDPLREILKSLLLDK